jgi:hypothetical protein
VTRASPPGAADLAKRLKGAGAQMYGAFWCSHCFDQKQVSFLTIMCGWQSCTVCTCPRLQLCRQAP